MTTQTAMALSLLAATMLGRKYPSNIQAALKCIFFENILGNLKKAESFCSDQITNEYQIIFSNFRLLPANFSFAKFVTNGTAAI